MGGPATAQLAWIPEFLAATKTAGSPVDFISSHLYPTDPFLNNTRDAFMDAVAVASALAATIKVPFMLTEFNAGLGSVDGTPPLLESSYAASFMLHQHLLVQGAPNVASMSWWTFTDFGFEEQGADPLPWHPKSAKFGAQTMYGVKKPVWRGMQMIGDVLAGDVVPVMGETATYKNAAGNIIGATSNLVDALVAVAIDGTITTLLTNFNAAGIVPTPTLINATVTFTGLVAPLPTSATLELIDQTHTNPMEVWINAGSPLYPRADEIAAEQIASELVPQTVSLAPGSDGVSVSITITLMPWAVARVRFTIN